MGVGSSQNKKVVTNFCSPIGKVAEQKIKMFYHSK